MWTVAIITVATCYVSGRILRRFWRCSFLTRWNMRPS